MGLGFGVCQDMSVRRHCLNKVEKIYTARDGSSALLPSFPFAACAPAQRRQTQQKARRDAGTQKRRKSLVATASALRLLVSTWSIEQQFHACKACKMRMRTGVCWEGCGRQTQMPKCISTSVLTAAHLVATHQDLVQPRGSAWFKGEVFSPLQVIMMCSFPHHFPSCSLFPRISFSLALSFPFLFGFSLFLPFCRL